MAKTSITAKLGLDTTAFQRGLAKSQKSIGNFVKSGIAKFGALTGAAGLGSMAKAAIDLGSKISDLAVQLNIGTDQLQTLDFAAREAGVGTEIMARALRNVQTRTEEAIKGNKSYGDAFEQLGINVNEFKKLSVEKRLEAIAVAQSKATDAGAAYNSVARILGEKAGPALQEVLQNLAGPQGYGGLEAAAKRAGEVMDKETIANMDEAADKIESFKRRATVAMGTALGAFTTFGERVGQGAAILVGYGEGMDAVFDEAPSKINKATESQNQFSKAVEKTTEKIKSLKEQISEYYKEAKKAQNAEREAFIKGKELDVLKLRAQGEKKAADELENKIESMKKAIEIADKYGISLRKAANLVENINRAEAKGETPIPSSAKPSTAEGKKGIGSGFKSKFGRAPTFRERERAAGLHNTTLGRDGARLDAMVDKPAKANAVEVTQKSMAENLDTIAKELTTTTR